MHRSVGTVTIVYFHIMAYNTFCITQTVTNVPLLLHANSKRSIILNVNNNNIITIYESDPEPYSVDILDQWSKYPVISYSSNIDLKLSLS